MITNLIRDHWRHLINETGACLDGLYCFVGSGMPPLTPFATITSALRFVSLSTVLDRCSLEDYVAAVVMMRRQAAFRPPRSSFSAMRRRAGRIRWPHTRTLCGSRPAVRHHAHRDRRARFVEPISRGHAAGRASGHQLIAYTAAPRSDRAHHGRRASWRPHVPAIRTISRFHPRMTLRMHWRARVETGPRGIESAVAL
jgi:hypothetical protein